MRFTSKYASEPKQPQSFDRSAIDSDCKFNALLNIKRIGMRSVRRWGEQYPLWTVEPYQ